MRLPARSTTRLLTLIAVALAGCQGGGEPVQVVTPPGMSMSLSAASVGVAQGKSGTVAVTITRINGYSGAVDLTVDGAPAGVTATLAPTTVPSAGTASTLTLTASSSAAAGSYTLTVRASGPGVSEKSATLTLTVTASPDFTLSVSPATLSLAQGGATAATITVTRTAGFADAVALTVTGAPAGVTAVASPASATGSSASLNITAATVAATGTFTLTVHGTASGSSERTASVALQVVPLATTVTLRFCGPDAPVWVAVQADGGSWAQVSPVGTDSYPFSVGSRAALGVVNYVDGGFETSIIYASLGELGAVAQAMNDDCALPPSSGSKQLSGTVAGVDAAHAAAVALGDAVASVQGAVETSFSLTGAPDLASDLVAVRQGIVTSGLAPDRLIIRRGLNLPTGSVIPVLDFGAAESFAPVTATATLSGLGADSAVIVSTLISAANTVAPLTTSSGTASQTFAGVPAAQLAAGDVHELFALAQAASDPDARRGALTHMAALADWPLQLGPALSIPTVTTVSATAPQRLHAVLAMQTDYSKNAIIDFSQSVGQGTTYRRVVLDVTAAYAGASATSWDVTIPDVTTAGYNPAWGLLAGAVQWSITAASATALSDVLGAHPQVGTGYVFAARNSPGAGLAARSAGFTHGWWNRVPIAGRRALR